MINKVIMLGRVNLKNNFRCITFTVFVSRQIDEIF